MTDTAQGDLPVVVIGAGPVGLAAAAHLLERGLEPLVLEAGDGPGAAVARWGHIRLFSPWRYDVDAAARRLLTGAGRAGDGAVLGTPSGDGGVHVPSSDSTWTEPDPDALPTGADLVERYLTPLAAALGERVRYGSRVLAVTRDGADRSRSLGRGRRPYLVRVTYGTGNAADTTAGAGLDGPEGRDAQHASDGPGGPEGLGVQHASDGSGRFEDIRARAVVDTSGTWDHPNPLGLSGLPVPGEREAGRFLAGALPDVLGRDRERFAGRHTLVVGMGHSAANTLLNLVELAEQEPGTRITWAIRGGSPRRLYGGGAADELPARGLLGTRLRDAVASGRITLHTRVSIDELSVEHAASVDATTVADGRERVRVRGGASAGALDVVVDVVAAATGFRPALDMLREVRLDLDPVVEAPRAIASLIDPDLHSCGTVPAHGEKELAHPDAGFYLAGMKSYGRAPTFLLATGYEQVRSIAAALAGDRAAADAVELNLPATGVCSSDLAMRADDDGTVSPEALAEAGSAVDACCAVPSTPQPITIGAPPADGTGTPRAAATGAVPPGALLGFATGTSHGRSSD